MKLQVLSLSQEVFSAYGDVTEAQRRDFFHINNGLVERYHDLALVETLEQGCTLININRAQPANLPLTIHELECYLLGTQAFIPMKNEVFMVVMTLDNGKPNLSTLRTSITSDEQGANYHRNVWHHPPFAWQHATDSLTIDHGGSDDCDVESIPERKLYFTWRLQSICIR